MSNTVSQKKIVEYDRHSLCILGMGDFRWALLRPWDHPSDLVTNGEMVRTTKIIEYDEETGRIETNNTIYVPRD